PAWTDGDVHYKLVAGEAFSRKSPVPVYSKLFMLEIKSTTTQTLNLGHALYGESGLYILEGSIESNGHHYEPKQILVATESSLCEFVIHANTTIYIFGGEPFPEERLIYWNFVASDQHLIDVAKEKWQAQQFKKIEGETNYVPLPLPRK
ncbi:MAG: pirin-like C-terminal cupin domain-containing protein, partial [Bacteroidota bacterium]